MKELKFKNHPIENCPDKEYTVEFIVFKNFLGVAKKNGLYNSFRRNVGCHPENSFYHLYGAFKCFNGRRRNDDSFLNVKDTLGLLKLITHHTHGMRGIAIEDEMKLQRHIANCVNILVHVFFERGIRDFNRLSQLGGEIFERSCKEIFGDDFKDLTEPSPEEKKYIEELQKILPNGTFDPSKITPEIMEQLQRLVELRQNSLQGEDQNLWYGESDDDFLDDEDEFLDEDNEEFFENEPF